MKPGLGLVLVVFVAAFFGTVHSQRNGAIRLILSGSPSTISSGIIEIYYNNAWGNICDDSYFGSDEADVVCHQLGYNGASSHGNSGSTSLFGTDTVSTALEDVSCITSSYLALLQCSVKSQYSTSCSSNTQDAYVACYSTRIWSSPYSGQIRLSSGTYSNYGRLEVYCNSRWGTVCDDSFGSTDANVACRQLGYSNAYTYSGNIAGSSFQPIWLDSVHCSSSSTSCLAYCQSCPSSQNHNCNHNQDVALGCEFGSSYTAPTTTTTTCLYADSLSNNIGSIIGGAIAAVIVCIICTIAVIAIPICICCCLGVGLGAASRSGAKRTVVTQHGTTSQVTAVSSTTGYPSDTGYAPQPATYPPPGEKDPAYPPQQYPPAPYPPQQYQPAPTGGYPPY